MVYLQVESLSYRFMDVFSRRRLLFPLTLVESTIIINVDLTHRLKVLTNNICSTQVDGERVQVFKDLKITVIPQIYSEDPLWPSNPQPKSS
jgi:hypothetical protein